LLFVAPMTPTTFPLTLFLVGLLACSGGTSSNQDPRPDASPGFLDATPGQLDAAPKPDGSIPTGTTTCGNLTCQAETEVCVAIGPFGPTNEYACEEVPTECLDDRSCECLEASFCPPASTQFCSSQDNVMFCDNGTQ
jgi:hypothetical protein